VDVILSTIDLPLVIVPLVSLEIPTLERLRSPAINHRALETSAWNIHYVWMVLEGEILLIYQLNIGHRT
jgi:hypothetical protein